MEAETHKKEVKKLSKIEAELGDMIAATDYGELMEKFLEWQEQRNTCNEGLIEMIKNLKDNGNK